MNKRLSFIIAILLLFSNIIGIQENKFLLFTTAPISITKSGGYSDGSYVEYSGTTSNEYNVYYKSGSSYIQIDSLLILKYSNYFRADVVGLKSGSYTLKV